ncbi:MAG: thermonuclease family protein [Pyrinomonadaceae bacterium]
MRKTLLLAIASICLLAGTSLAQHSTAGEVVDVIDGKTLALLTNSGRSIVELQYIEVPQQGPMAETVKTHLRLLALGKKAVYMPHVIRDDRSAGVLEIGGVDMAGQMLRDGAAWHVPSQLSGQPAGESDEYGSLETSAKKEGRGVWTNSSVKPPWEAPEKPPVSGVILASERSTSRQAASPKNPRLGDTGMLLNGYDPASRTGFLSLGLFGLGMAPDVVDDVRFAVDFSYYYKEDERFKRTGSFVFTLVSDAAKPIFDKDSSLVLYGGGSPITIPAGKRFVKNIDGRVVEKMFYRMDSSIIKRIINNNSAFMKVHNHVLVMTGARYLLYTMVQVTG